MEACFNELSVRSDGRDVTDVEGWLNRYADVVSCAVKDWNFKKIRYALRFDAIRVSENETLASYCYKNQRNTKVQLLLSTQRYPYIDSRDSDVHQEQYVKTEAYLSDTDEKAEGFLIAYIMNTICVGFASEDRWFNVGHRIRLCSDSVEELVDWVCISDVSHFQSESFLDWHSANAPLSLVKCDILPESKSVRLRDDHGKDTLMKHADAIKQSPYVVKVINSLPFNPRARDYIHKVRPNGLIEIVLTNTDNGLGLVVQSTGRNLKETKRIAEIIKEKYGSR